MLAPAGNRAFGYQSANDRPVFATIGLRNQGWAITSKSFGHADFAALADVDRDVRDWLRQAPAAPPAPAPLPPREDPQAVVLPAASPAAPSSASTWVAHPGGAAAAPATAPRRSGQTVARGRDALSELEAYVAAHPSARIEVTWRVVE